MSQRSRMIAGFLGLTLLYSIALLAFCSGGGGGGGGGTTNGAGLSAESLDQLQLAQATGRPIQQLKCLTCPKCPEQVELAPPVPCPECKQDPPVECPAPAPTPPSTVCPPAPACPACPAPPEPAAAVVVTPPSQPHSQATFTTTTVLSDPSDPNFHPLDSQGAVYTILGRGAASQRGDQYKLCSFTRVCAQHGRLLFAAHDAAHAAAQAAEWKSKCWKVAQWEQPAICSCFHGNFVPSFLTEEQLAVAEKEAGVYKPHHYWSMHKWVNVHHIAHWAQKLVIFQAVFQHARNIPLPPLEGILFHDSDPPLSDHEQVIFDAAIAAALQHGAGAGAGGGGGGALHPLARKEGREDRLVWANTLDAQQSTMESAHESQRAEGLPLSTSPSQLTCFERLSLTPHYGIFSTHPEDTSAFRDQVYRHFKLPPAQRCPPRRAVLLYRHNRGIVNRDEIRSMLLAEFGVELEFQTIDGGSSSLAQVSLFASTGLMLSSHSSQLINVLFSPGGGAMVEVAPEFYNADFGEYAHGMGVFFQYALGGSVPDGEEQPSQRACVDHLSRCEGSSFCVLEQRHKCANRAYPNKNRDFVANLTAVRIAVKNSLQHLNWLCTGRW